jgi:hypothetical protein
MNYALSCRTDGPSLTSGTQICDLRMCYLRCAGVYSKLLGPAASGMYVAVAVGPLGWHGDRRNSPCFPGLDALFWVDRLDGGGVVFQVVPRT